MQARMKNPAMIVPGAMQARQDLTKSAEQTDILPLRTLGLFHLGASQVNGCSVCVDMAFRFRKAEDTDERLFAVAAWREGALLMLNLLATLLATLFSILRAALPPVKASGNHQVRDDPQIILQSDADTFAYPAQMQDVFASADCSGGVAVRSKNGLTTRIKE